DAPGDGVVFETDYANSRQMASWVLGLGERARVLGPPELVEEASERVRKIVECHANPPEVAGARKRRAGDVVADSESSNGKRETAIRPERFARLVTLAGILIEAARTGSKLSVRTVRDSMQITDIELREDIDVLNVVNFGGGSYVLYAEVSGDTIEVDPEPYGDNFAKPARLLPLEAKALVAAIDLLGDHIPGAGSLASARDKIVAALGRDPATDGLQITTASGDDSEVARVVSQAVTEHRVLEIEYYKENEDEFSNRRGEPYALMNSKEGWYVHLFDLQKEAPRSFRLDRIKSVNATDETFEPRPGVEPDISGWPTTGEVESGDVARVLISPERARWERENRRVVADLSDGSLIVELSYASDEYLAREILKEAGDAVVLEPDDARRAVLEAAEAVAGTATRR
ncbi:MAG: proteasome accessory factor, partial [Thermoleophilaceae bacterium]|nr:proteasome accessory factor [Thermoleophilaceae bacterium]